MAKYRSLQLLRNDAITSYASHEAAINAIPTALANVSVKDGELVLYRYKLDGDADTIHTQVVAAHVNGDGSVKKFEIVANYDQLKNLVNSLDTTVRGTSDGTVSAIDTAFAVTGSTGAHVAVEVVEEDGIITAVNVIENIDETIENAINALDTENDVTIASVTDNVVTLKAGIAQVDGLIQQGTGADITLAKVATTGAAEDVAVTPNGNLTSTNVQDALEELQGDIDTINGQSINAAENQAVEVSTVGGETTIGLKLVDGEKVLSQTTAGLKTTLTVDTKKYPTESTAEGYVAEKAGKTYIQIKGIDNEVISETDAAAFVKDGFLQSVELIEATEGQENVLRFTWNSDAGSQVTEINVSDLCDVYTADETYLHLNGFKFEHKEQSGLPTAAQGIVEAVTGTGAYTETKTFKVPQLTVDAAGHVTAVNEKEVSITLPSKQVASDVAVTPNGNLTSTNVQTALEELQGDIDAINGVTWSGDAEINVNNTNHTITHTAHTVTPTTSTNDTAVKAVVIPQLTVNAAGHVTAIDNKTFNIDCNVTTVSGTANQIVVTPTEAGEDVNYTVSLAEARATVTNDTDDYVAANGTHTRISDITVDNYGRVTAVTKTTVTEDIDAGTY